ncbi:MAG: type I restriction-modification system endonuclease [Flavobacteriaceae bacterium]|nr:type I restriction-modification system endonuclease [Flavobacteriaceae bacterium]
MSSTNFDFLELEFPLLFNLGQSAEYNVSSDPVVTLIKLRQFAEKLSENLFEIHRLDFPYDNTIHNKLKTLEFEGILPDAVKDLLFNIKNRGNTAVHQIKGTKSEATGMLFSGFKVAKWFYQTYSDANEDISSLKFKEPKELDARHALNELEKQYKDLEARFEKVLEERPKEALTNEQSKAIAIRSEKAAKKIDMSEAETRVLIDQQLRAVGWEVDTDLINFKSKKTLPQRGRNMAIAEWPADGKWADYALFIGLKFYGIIEAKKYSSDISTDLFQSKIYAEKVKEEHEAELLGEWQGYKVPFLFSTNGRPFLEQIKTKSGVWFLDVRQERNRAKALKGWYSPDGLQKLYEQDLKAAEERLKAESKDFLTDSSGLGLRYYQIEAIEAVEKLLINNPEQSRALLAMATGTGKTRTVIGLCYRLIQTNRFRRILFLVDRRLLAKQAADAFTDNKVVGLNTFAEIYDVKGLKDLDPEDDTRLHFATVQSMVKRLFYSDDEDKPAIDQYDCIIIDEAHRGYLLDREIDDDDINFKDQRDYVSKYRMVLDYFDCFSVGLTATPALHTTEIFGRPIYTYSYREAVIDNFLVDHDPPYLIKTKLSEEDIVWEAGEKPKAYDKETNSIIELAELEDELRVEVSGFNKLVMTENFNREVVKYLVNEALDPDSEYKTLIFAATDEHADRVVQYLKEEFENVGYELPDDAIQKITGKSYDPEEQVKRYKNEKYPNIAVTVDLLTTGIDVPAISNLVFLRRIRSRILFEQMLGRATRKCDEINKEVFQIYDAVKVYETLEDFTQMKPVVANPKNSFQDLVKEFDELEKEERVRRQIEQIIAKLQRKRIKMTSDQLDLFVYNTKGEGLDEFIERLAHEEPGQAEKTIKSIPGLWKALDEMKPQPPVMLVSEHDDELISVERGYGKAQKPEDYLDSFKSFILNNQTKIEALNLVCTKPDSLDRKSLRALMLELDQAGFSANRLNIAWKDAKNEEIAADIISFIRTMALGDSLISHEERIRKAVDKIRAFRSWNKIQHKWIDRFESQLIKENILKVEDLNDSPFKDHGGYERLNKIFNEELDYLLGELNQALYDNVG